MILTRKDIQMLADIRTKGCVSIYMPTHKTGLPTFTEKDKIQYKNLLSRAATKLSRQGFRSVQIDHLLDPATAFLDESKFWRYQSDGLAVFIAGNFFRYYHLPISFDPYCYVSDDLCLEPMLPYFTGDGKYYLLTLALHEVQLYEGTRYDLQLSEIEDLFPSRLEEVVGYDYREKFLQFRTSQGGGGATYHGHAEWQDNKKVEILKFLRKINETLMKHINQEKVPLVLCASDYMYSLYQKANSYDYLLPRYIPVNPAGRNTQWLHKESWKVVGPEFSGIKTEKENLFRKLQGTGQTTNNPGQILPAAYQGKVKTLFIRKGSELYGSYDSETAQVKITSIKSNGYRSLINQAAIKTFLSGGCVFVLENEEMPDQSADMNALLRY